MENKKDLRSLRGAIISSKDTFNDAIRKLPGKIIGHNEHMGVYNLVVLGSGDTDGILKRGDEVIGQEKFELERGGTENYMRFSFVSMHLKHLMGEVLTTLEASISDERQLKATKSIIKNYFGRKIDWVYENCGMPEDEQEYLEEN